MQTILEGFGFRKWIKYKKMTHSERQSIIRTAKYQNYSKILKSTEKITQMATIDNIENLTNLELSRCLRERCGWTMKRIVPKRCWITNNCVGEVQWFPAPNSFTANVTLTEAVVYGSLSAVREDIRCGLLTLCGIELQNN